MQQTKENYYVTHAISRAKTSAYIFWQLSIKFRWWDIALVIWIAKATSKTKHRSKTNDGWHFNKNDPKQPANGGLKNEMRQTYRSRLVLTVFYMKHLQMNQNIDMRKQLSLILKIENFNNMKSLKT